MSNKYNSQAHSSQKQSLSNWKSTSPKNTKTNIVRTKNIPPEDDWDLVANPNLYLDELPQPFRFVNNCLEKLILQPVF